MTRRFVFACLAMFIPFACAQTPVPTAQVGAVYKVQLGAAVSGVYPFHFTVGDHLPDGLTLSDAGLLSGTPTTATRGPVGFTVTISDATGNKVGSFPFSITVGKDAVIPLVIAGGVPVSTPKPSVQAPDPPTNKPAPPASAADPAASKPGPPPNVAVAPPTTTPDTHSDPPRSTAAPGVAAAANPPTPQGGGAAGDTPQFTIAADNPGRIGPGGSLTFTATPTSGSLPDPISWTVIDPSPGEGISESTYSISRQGKKQAILTLAPDAVAPSSGILSVLACPTGVSCDKDHASQNATAGLDIKVIDHPAGLMVIPVIGFEQVGASAAASTQKFFFDFFLSRPFPFLHVDEDKCLQDDDCKVLGPALRMWGGVRIGSYPQQISSGVGEFASGFATRVAQLPVNKLAQAGEFNLGLERRIRSFPWSFSSVSSDSNQRIALSLVAGFGGISPFNPVEVLQIFQNPAPGSPQAAAFFKQFPSSQNSTFTGFTTPDRDRFFWEYGAGIRLTLPFLDKANLQRSGPAMLTYMLGQNQMVSGGISRGVVQRIEAFYPLPLGERFADGVTSLYLYGRADMRLASPHQTTPFILQPAPSTVNGFDPNVNIVSLRSNRDLYTVGVGVDAVHLIKTMTMQNANKSSPKPSK